MSVSVGVGVNPVESVPSLSVGVGVSIPSESVPSLSVGVGVNPVRVCSVIIGRRGRVYAVGVCTVVIGRRWSVNPVRVCAVIVRGRGCVNPVRVCAVIVRGSGCLSRPSRSPYHRCPWRVGVSIPSESVPSLSVGVGVSIPSESVPSLSVGVGCPSESRQSLFRRCPWEWVCLSRRSLCRRFVYPVAVIFESGVEESKWLSAQVWASELEQDSEQSPHQ